jgi:hypothetical protein
MIRGLVLAALIASPVYGQTCYKFSVIETAQKIDPSVASLDEATRLLEQHPGSDKKVADTFYQCACESAKVDIEVACAAQYGLVSQDYYKFSRSHPRTARKLERMSKRCVAEKISLNEDCKAAKR